MSPWRRKYQNDHQSGRRFRTKDQVESADQSLIGNVQCLQPVNRIARSKKQCRQSQYAAKQECAQPDANCQGSRRNRSDCYKNNAEKKRCRQNPDFCRKRRGQDKCQESTNLNPRIETLQQSTLEGHSFRRKGTAQGL